MFFLLWILALETIMYSIPSIGISNDYLLVAIYHLLWAAGIGSAFYGAGGEFGNRIYWLVGLVTYYVYVPRYYEYFEPTWVALGTPTDTTLPLMIFIGIPIALMFSPIALTLRRFTNNGF